MPMSMINSRTDDISEISRQTGHSRSFISIVRDANQSNENVFELKNKLGAGIKINNDIQNQIMNLTIQNRRMAGQQIADIVSNNIQNYSISTSSQKINYTSH